MDYQEIVDRLKELYYVVSSHLNESDMDAIIEAVEKQVCKDTVECDDNNWHCPMCNTVWYAEADHKNYCQECGQRLW